MLAAEGVRPAVEGDAPALARLYNESVLPALAPPAGPPGSVAAWAQAPTTAADWAAALRGGGEAAAGHGTGVDESLVVNQRWWVAARPGGELAGCVAAALVPASPGGPGPSPSTPDHPTTDGAEFGALCYFWYRTGDREAGAALLAAAEAHLVALGAARCFAFVTELRPAFCYTEYLSDRAGHVHALLQAAGYER